MSILSTSVRPENGPGPTRLCQQVIVLASKRIPECDVVESATVAAAVSILQDLATAGLGAAKDRGWQQWREEGMDFRIRLANRSDFSAVRRAAFSAGAVAVDAGDASAVAFGPTEYHLVPPRLVDLTASFPGQRVKPRARKNASAGPILFWDATLPTPQAIQASLQSIHRWIGEAPWPTLVRWYDKGCAMTVIGVEPERLRELLTYVAERQSVASVDGREVAGVIGPVLG